MLSPPAARNQRRYIALWKALPSGLSRDKVIADETGVAQVSDHYREELQNAMLATGCAKISDIDPSLIV